MKPAPSIVGFTTASGLGYGMLFVLAAGSLLGVIPVERWLGLAGLSLALGTITAGLLSSTLHLGHPERAWRAISQWRSSWLSREGLLALLTYVPAILFAWGWVINENVGGFYGLMAIVAGLGAAATVYCTGMIYASLPPIHAWHQPLTAPVYLAFALMTGLLAVHFLLVLFGSPHLVIGALTLIATAGTFFLKIWYWRVVAEERSSRGTTADATGLGSSSGLRPSGLVRMLDPPHTQTNYLLEEMGFLLGRKHARLLRMLTYLFGLFMPLIFTLVALTLASWVAIVLAFLALLSGMIGVLIERWLFFAEAEHTVMLYYGGQSATGTKQMASFRSKSQHEQAEQPKAKKDDRRRPAPMRRRQTVQATK